MSQFFHEHQINDEKSNQRSLGKMGLSENGRTPLFNIYTDMLVRFSATLANFGQLVQLNLHLQ